MFVVHPTVTMSDPRPREIMASLRGKMMDVCEVTQPFSDANSQDQITLARNSPASNKETKKHSETQIYPPLKYIFQHLFYESRHCKEQCPESKIIQSLQENTVSPI